MQGFVSKTFFWFFLFLRPGGRGGMGWGWGTGEWESYPLSIYSATRLFLRIFGDPAREGGGEKCFALLKKR